MASKVWLLVEWVNDSKMFSSYDVVSRDCLAYYNTHLEPGIVVYIRTKHGNPRRAKVHRISESKQYVKEHKEILERQDQQFKSVLQICMQNIQEVKNNNWNVQYNPQLAANQIAAPHVIIPSRSNNVSNNDFEDRSRVPSFDELFSKFPQYVRKEAKIHPMRGFMNTSQQSDSSMISSTPIPGSIRQYDKLYFDQGSQTDEVFLKPPLEKIETLETALKSLYRSFQSVVSQVNQDSNGLKSLSDSENDDEVSYTGSNVSMIEQSTTDEDQISVEMDDHIQNEGAEEMIEESVSDQSMNNSNRDVRRVRRMSAQTTNRTRTVSSNDNDLVPIGKGNAKIPLRVLQDINWRSHTTATRQLLQAVFPRNVLATHCLTGKQSPAFMNRPAKKILDPKLVEDIVKIVSTRCGVPKNLVRNSITIKCTDEAKLYRNRQHYKQQRKHIENDENSPPSALSSDESTNTLIN